METKDTLSLCSDSEEQDMHQMLQRAKILKGSCLNGLSKLKSNLTLKLEQGITKSEFERAFSHIFGEDVDTFTRTFSQNMDTLEQQLTKETILESNCQNAFRVLKTQFEKMFTSVLIKPSSLDGTMFLNMDQLEKQLDKEEFQEIGFVSAFKILEFHDILIQHMESVKKSIDERALHKREYDTRVNGRQMLTTEEKVDSSEALDVSLVDIESSGTESKEQDTSSRSGNDAHADEADIRPIYDEEPMARTVAQFQKDFLRMEAHCVNLELKYKNQALKEGKHGQFLKVKSKEAKIKHDIDVIETITIQLEHKVAKLLKENETFKRHYKELYDSIKTMRAKTTEHATSLIAQNAEFKVQLQEIGFAIAALKNEFRILT
ncbi:hypothetical protein Tco_0045708 [Tanacetum coccineum]